MQGGVQRRDDRRSRCAVAVKDLVDQLLAIDRVRDGEADFLILHVRVAVADGLAIRCRGAQVEGELVEAGVVTRVRRDAFLALEGAEDVGGETAREVDLALDQRLTECVGVVVDPEDELVDVGAALEVVVVGHHADELTGAPLDDEERSRADGDLALGRLVGEGLHGLAVDAAPHVLGQDVDREPLHDRRRLLRGHDDRAVVGRGDRRDVADVVAEVALLVAAVEDPLEGVDDVIGRERDPVGPQQVRAQGVGPGLAVGRGLPRLRQARVRREVDRARRQQRGVLQLEDLVGLGEDPGEGIERVDIGKHADGEHNWVCGLCLGHRRGGHRHDRGRGHAGDHSADHVISLVDLLVVFGRASCPA